MHNNKFRKSKQHIMLYILLLVTTDNLIKQNAECPQFSFTSAHGRRWSISHKTHAKDVMMQWKIMIKVIIVYGYFSDRTTKQTVFNKHWCVQLTILHVAASFVHYISCNSICTTHLEFAKQVGLKQLCNTYKLSQAKQNTIKQHFKTVKLKYLVTVFLMENKNKMQSVTYFLKF